ncbi:MAG: hypothetical protein Q8P27_02120, partial [Candidatus Peregrinibacteria bacterium]|nr:hypothetical protein [Candidatus Peregrinibacteria bacterium]
IRRAIGSIRAGVDGTGNGTGIETAELNAQERVALEFVNELIASFNDFLRRVEGQFPEATHGPMVRNIMESIFMNLDVALSVTTPTRNEGQENIEAQLNRIFTYFETFVQQGLETLWFTDVPDLDVATLEERTVSVPDTLNLRSLRFNPSNASRVPSEIAGTLQTVSEDFQRALEDKFNPHLEQLIEDNREFFEALFENLSLVNLTTQRNGALFSATEKAQFARMAMGLRATQDVRRFIEDVIRDSDVMDMINKMKYIRNQTVETTDEGVMDFFDAIKTDKGRNDSNVRLENFSILGGYKMYLTSTVRTAEKARSLIEQGYPAAVNSTHIKGYAFDFDRKYLGRLVDPDQAPDFDVSTSTLNAGEDTQGSVAEFMDREAARLMDETNLDEARINVVVEKGQCYHIAQNPKFAENAQSAISGKISGRIAQTLRSVG